MEYAENYYLHYPKVAFGHWPPFFYIVQAAWTLLFSPSRASLMLLMAAMTALLSTTLFVVIRREFSFRAGMAVGFVLVSLPIIQQHTRMVMADMLAILLIFLAVLLFARYLDSLKWQDAAWFGVVSCCAILTKGAGFLLAPVSVVSVLLSWRLRLLKRFSFWLPALIVIAFCGPWYLLAPGSFHQAAGLRRGVVEFGWYWDLYVAPLVFLKTFGVCLSPFVVAGFVHRVCLPVWNRERLKGIWVAAAALLLSMWILLLAIGPFREYRQMISIVPVSLLFASAGVSWALASFPLSRLTSRRQSQLVALVVLVLVARWSYGMPSAPYRGFSEVAEQLLVQSRFEESVLLICSDARGEGMLISEVARRERRPGHVVLRGSKVLSSSSWFGESYRLLYSTPAETMGFLRSVPVGLLVLDFNPLPKSDHLQLLEETIRAYPDDWELLGKYRSPRPEDRSRAGILVYRLIGHEKRPPGKIRIDMTARLGKIIEN
jgi:hypothetical protein